METTEKPVSGRQEDPIELQVCHKKIAKNSLKRACILFSKSALDVDEYRELFVVISNHVHIIGVS